MKTKLTLRMDDGMVRKAKRIAQRRGTSVSQVFVDFIAQQTDEEAAAALPPLTASMLGALKRGEGEIDEPDYYAHLETKYR